MVVLGSKSPRRQELLRGLDIPFIVRTKDTDESYPSDLQAEWVPEYIARLKAAAFYDLNADDVLVTADTVVIVDGKIYGKPHSRDEACGMLRVLAGRTHEVVTGVCIRRGDDVRSFSDLTKVHFAELTDREIEYYVDKYRPFDKAGSYGVQEWIGYVAVDWIEGSFYNVMGLPVHKVYEKICDNIVSGCVVGGVCR